MQLAALKLWTWRRVKSQPANHRAKHGRQVTGSRIVACFALFTSWRQRGFSPSSLQPRNYLSWESPESLRTLHSRVYILGTFNFLNFLNLLKFIISARHRDRPSSWFTLTRSSSRSLFARNTERTLNSPDSGTPSSGATQHVHEVVMYFKD